MTGGAGDTDLSEDDDEAAPLSVRLAGPLSGVAVPLNAVVGVDLKRKLGLPVFAKRRLSDVR